MINNVVLEGRITADPQLRETASGVKVTSFTIAVDRNRPDKDGNYVADFIPVSAWNQAAEFFCANFKKGDYVSVVGRLNTSRRPIEGSDKMTTVVGVTANSITFSGYKRQN